MAWNHVAITSVIPLGKSLLVVWQDVNKKAEANKNPRDIIGRAFMNSLASILFLSGLEFIR